LTDNRGRVANFKNTLIIMTSNMGAETILENFEDLDAVGEDHRADIIKTTKEEVFDHLKENLRPEFLNRIDEQIMFLPLSRKEIHAILKLLMRKVDKMLARQGIVVKMSDRALDLLADRGYDPQFGARPMKRVLQRDVINELSKEVLSSKFISGDTIYIDAGKAGLSFSKEPFEGVVNDPAKVQPPTEAEKAAEKAEAKAQEEAEEAKRKEHRKKQLEELQKATQDVMDAAKEVKKKEEAKKKEEK